MNKVELIAKLRTYDEVLLMELLQLTSDDLVDAFLDKIYDNIEYIYSQIKETGEI